MAGRKDECPVYPLSELDKHGKKRTRIVRDWLETITEYGDKTTAFTGPPRGYVGRCNNKSKEIDFFMELFGEAAEFIVEQTNKHMDGRDDQTRRSKRLEPPAPPDTAVVATAGPSTAPQPTVTEEDEEDLVYYEDNSDHGDESSDAYEEDYEQDDDDEDSDRLSEGSHSGTEAEPEDEPDSQVASTSQESTLPSRPPQPSSSSPLVLRLSPSPETRWSRSPQKQRKRLRTLQERKNYDQSSPLTQRPRKTRRMRKDSAKTPEYIEISSSSSSSSSPSSSSSIEEVDPKDPPPPPTTPMGPSSSGVQGIEPITVNLPLTTPPELSALKDAVTKLQTNLDAPAAAPLGLSALTEVLLKLQARLAAPIVVIDALPQPSSSSAPVPESSQSSPPVQAGQHSQQINIRQPPSLAPETSQPAPTEASLQSPTSSQPPTLAPEAMLPMPETSQSSQESSSQPFEASQSARTIVSETSQSPASSQSIEPSQRAPPTQSEGEPPSPSQHVSVSQSSSSPKRRAECVEEGTQTSPRKRIKKVVPWTPLTKEELLGFIACMIIMGYDDQPEMQNYWSTASDLGNHAIRTAMTRVRFSQVWNNFRLSAEPSFTGVDPNTASPQTRQAMAEQKAKEDNDALMKLRPMMEAINERFRACRNPSSHICIDESMTAYAGRTKIKIYQPKKPIKLGFEHFTVCDSQDGYILNDEAHIGKKNHMAVDPAQDPAAELKKRLKMAHTTTYAARHYLNKGYTLVCDNRFTSALLFETLYLKLGTFACGSLRAKAGAMPKDWSDGTLKKFGKQPGVQRGDYTMRQNGRLLFTVWNDTKPVALLSTNVDPLATPGTINRVIGGHKREVTCPAPAITYTSHMGGVDMANHLVSSFYVGRRCKIWHRYLFFQKLNQILVNARLNMMMAYGKKKVHQRSQLSFRRALVTQLLDLLPKVRPVRLPAIAGTVHVQERANASRRCRVCSKFRQERHETVWWCRTCRTHVCHDNFSRRLFLGRTCWQLHVDRIDV